MWEEFKKFAVRGSVLDLAIGVVIGAAFGKIVTSFVNDIISPVVGLFLGHIKFENLFISLAGHYDTLADAQIANAPTLNYGLFIQNIIDFLIVAFVIFLVIRYVNRFREQEEGRDCPFCTLPISPSATRCPHCTAELQR